MRRQSSVESHFGFPNLFHAHTYALMAASFKWILQLHKDVPKAARFYSEGLDFTVNVCTLRWAELQSGPLKLSLMQSPKYFSSTAYFFSHARQLFDKLPISHLPTGT